LLAFSVASRIWRRWRALVFPQIPASLCAGLVASTYSRQCALTRHVAQIAVAAVVASPRVGKKSSVGWSLQAASAI
jgi:hypothetical protein